jgi:hypothetical protein
MLTSRTVTKALRIEAKQHELFGFDLGEGLDRKKLGLGVLAFVVWVVITLPLMTWTGILAVRPDVGSLIILAPPIVTIMLGFQPDDDLPQRIRLTLIALKIRYVLVGSRPIIHLGRREAERAERLPLAERLGRDSVDETERPTQPTIRLNARARLIGNDELHELVTTQSKKGKRP